MFFTAPLALALLVPWGLLVAWSLVRRPPAVDVPFVHLWRGRAPVSTKRRGTARPPLAVTLVLAAILAAVLGAAGPRWSAGGGGEVTVVVDRGLTMSASTGTDSRYRVGLKELADALPTRTTVHVVTVPGGAVVTGDAAGLPMLAATIEPTAVDTRSAVVAAVASARTPVLAVTDADLPRRDGVVRIAPPPPGDDVAITLVAARATPRPQVMVRLRNTSARGQVTVTVRSGAASVSADVRLPPRGQTVDHFADLPALADTVQVTLGSRDAVAANDVAYLAAGGAWAKPEPRGPLPREVADVLAAYARARPASDASTTVAVTTEWSPHGSEPTIVVAPPAGTPLPATVDPVVSDDPLVRDVDWRSALAGAALAAPPAGPALVPLVSVGDRPAVAATATTPRRVWVGFRSTTFPTTPGFAIFWTNVLDAFGGAREFTGVPAQQLGGGWTRLTGGPDTDAGYWPGLYRRGDGGVRAVNAPDVPISAAVAGPDWRPAVRSALTATGGGGRRLSGVLLLASAGLLLAAFAAARWGAARVAGVA